MTLALYPQIKKVVGSIPGLRPFCVELACSHCVSVGSPQVLPLPPPVQKPCEVNSKLSIGVCESE